MRVVHISTIHQALDVRIFMKECRTLASYGYEVFLVIQSPPADSLDGVYFLSLGCFSSVGRFKRLWMRYSSAWKTASQLRGNIYHFHDPELIVLGLFLKMKGALVVYDVHEDAPREALSLNKEKPVLGILKFFIWWVLESVAKITLDRFVCVTPSILAKFPQRRCYLVQNFPLIEELQAYQESYLPYASRANWVVYAGNITAIRGVREMVEAISSLPEQLASQLHLLGKFSSSALQAEVLTGGGNGRVIFDGWHPRQHLIERVGLAKVGIVVFHPEPDHLEAIPNKLFEYMAAGLPVVASDFPIWRSLITALDCGLVVNPLDSLAIADAIQYLLENPIEAERMGKNGQRAVQERYHWEMEADTLLQLYKELSAKVMAKHQ